MAKPQTSSIHAADPLERAQRAGARPLAPAAIFVIASLAAIASDVGTPFGATIIIVGVVLAVMAVASGILFIRSGDKTYEAGMVALVLPLALCGYAVFDLREGQQGRPPSGVIARALPAVEQLQAKLFPMSPDTKTALLLEATLKTGDAAAKGAAVGKISEQKSMPLRKYLYETAAGFGDDSQKQLVAAAVLAGRAGQPISVELQDEDHTTLFAQYLEGSSIRFASADHHTPVRAQLGTNKELVSLEGRLTGPALALTGKANVADRDLPLTLDVAMGRDLTFAGSFRLAGGQDVAVTFQPF